MIVPCKFEPTAFPTRNPKEDNQTFVDHHVKISMIRQVREESVLSSYHRNIVVSSLDADHNEPQHPPAAKQRTSFTSFEKVHTHTHTHTHTPLLGSGMGGVGGMITYLGLAHILAYG